MKNEFFAIDFETANSDRSSICQIGIAAFQDNEAIGSWGILVNPEDWFDGMNISIHGIDEVDVEDAPTFADVFPAIRDLIDGAICVCHTSFDKSAFEQAVAKYGLDAPDCTWIDSAMVSKRVWKEVSQRGYGLENMCRIVGHDFREGDDYNGYHDAKDDAIAAGHVMIAAMKKSGEGLEEWVNKQSTRSAFSPATADEVIREIGNDLNKEGDLIGEVVVFTGALSQPRREYVPKALEAGCKVGGNVTKKTTILVVGDQEVAVLNGHDLSSKHRKAIQLIEKGQPIRLLGETDFMQLIAA